MSGPDPRRLALVRCIFDAGDNTESNRLGTGYFVTSDLLLTASHVIPDQAIKKIELRLEKGANTWQTALNAPVWRDVTLDAVLLRAFTPLEELPPVKWHEGELDKDAPWNSTAYPFAASQKKDGFVELKSLGLRGILSAQGGGGQGPRDLDLSVEAEPEQSWAGISGAPVFVGDELIGIIKSELDKFSGKRIAGTPASLLFENVKFRLALAPQWLEDVPNQPWVLLVLSSGKQAGLEKTVQGALEMANEELKTLTGQPVYHKPRVVMVNDALESPEHWLKFVQAICVAPVMIADITGLEPAVMLSLGVRAVVRRGVTLTTTANLVDESELSELPFNIQEAKLICHGYRCAITDPKHPMRVIHNAIRDGLSELRSRANYLDLPAYDAVRSKLPDVGSRSADPRELVLILCSFHPNYKDNYLQLSNALWKMYPDKTVGRMMDIVSPRLVGQALYEHIRWTTTCVIDWTYWRANVFFECGVRLACSNYGAVHLLEQSELSSEQDIQKQRLIDLFRPVSYSLGSEGDVYDSAFSGHELIKSGNSPPQPKSVLAHNATYKICIEAFDWKQEQITLKPHEIMRASAEEQLGKDPQMSGIRPVLFSVGADFSRALRQSVWERWIAAWYYLRNRYPLEAFESNDQLRREIVDLGSAVLDWLPKSEDKYFMTLRKEIEKLIDQLE